jgi:Ca2+-binding RTX toxin-like protein
MGGVKLGTSRALGLMLLAVGVCATGALAGIAGAGAIAEEPAPVASKLVRAQNGSGASAASNTTIFVIQGTPMANHLTASADSTGRLVVSSPEGIVEPDGPAPECVQDSPTQVSCIPGYVGALAGDLGGGPDSFSANPRLTTLVGISLVTQQRPLAGGPGRDRIVGGLGGDLITGGDGRDALLGFGGGDLIAGEGGRDSLSGGGASDRLLGGAGRDRLDGGAARDLCNGGGGADTAKRCNVTKRIP